MKFELVDREGFIPELTYGEPGREMQCFVPDGYEWQQTNYEQGEGQVLINGHRWGFYYAQEGISIVLESGVVTIGEATTFVQAVKEKIYGEKSREVQIVLVGRDVHV